VSFVISLVFSKDILGYTSFSIFGGYWALLGGRYTMHRKLARFNSSYRYMALGAVALFCSLTPSASAAAIGMLNEANCSAGGVMVTETTITWLPLGTLAGTGCISTGSGTNVTYSGGTLSSGVTGNIEDLTSPGGIVNDFMTFQGTTLDFVLDGFTTPTTTNGTNCASTTVGQTCVVFSGSPFLLTNLGGGDTAVALSAFGTIVDGGVTSNWSGSFTTQLTETPGAIQTTELGGGSISSTQSAQFTLTATPEPGSFTMMVGAGLLALAFAAQRRKART
jgi:hypothetical protein